MPFWFRCCFMGCLAQSAAEAKDALLLLHTHAHKAGHQTVMKSKVKEQGQSAGAPFDVFDMRDHPKNRDHEGDCKWRCNNNDRCARYEYDAVTLICNMFEQSKEHLNQSAPFDVFDMRDHKKNRDNEGDCKWRCDNNYRCVRHEYDAGTLLCKLFEKSKDDSHQNAPFDVFDMRDHPKNRDHEGDCKWRCDVNDRCARYEYDAVTLICKLFEKYHVEQDGKHTFGDDDNEDTEEKHDKTSKNGFKHDTEKDDNDDEENSENIAKDDKGNKKSKQVAKRNSDQNGKKTKQEHEAKKTIYSVSDKHDKDSKKEKSEKKKIKEEFDSKPSL